MRTKISPTFPPVYSVCINLKTRKEKKSWAKRQVKKQQFKTSFFNATPHKNPRRGCLESHLSVIKNALKQKVKYLLVMEDDIKFIRPIKMLTPPPNDWAMCYLGGTVKHVFKREKKAPPKKGKNIWVRMTCWTTHAYILNLTHQKVVQAILQAEKTAPGTEIDRYYIDNIHPKFPCYMACPMICIQRAGYSDIEKKEVEYSFMERSLYGFRRAPHEITPDNSYRLKMPDLPPNLLPGVSIITPTRNRSWIFSMPKFNFSRFAYPKERLEWIIIDSSPTDDLKHLFPPNDPHLRYLHVPEPCTIAHKRNLGCKIARYDYIVHMDDDDIYVPESLIARIKPLVCYKGVECVGCSKIGVYDIYNDRSYISSDGNLSLSEASMAYTKKFWQERNFDPTCKRGEYRSFIQNRFEKIMDLPYIFVIIAMNHKRNFTPRTQWLEERGLEQETIRHAKTGKRMNFPDMLDEDTQMFLESLRKYILNSKWNHKKSDEKKSITETKEEKKNGSN